MLVREVMTTDPITVRLGTTIQATLLVLADAGVTSLPVVAADGRLRGVVSEADLIRDRVGRDPRLHEIPDEPEVLDLPRVVDEVMTPHAITVRADTDLAEAVELITSTSIKSVPVVDSRGRVRGIVSSSDVVRLLARADDDLAGEVDAALVSVGLTDWLVEVHDGVVDMLGPERTRDSSLARIVAGTVAGVAEVRIDP